MPFARSTDPSTSYMAAASVTKVNATQAAILRLLSNTPMNDDVLIWSYQQGWNDTPRASVSGIRSRRAELVALGLVKDSGERVKLPSGRYAIVWQVA